MKIDKMFEHLPPSPWSAGIINSEPGCEVRHIVDADGKMVCDLVPNFCLGTSIEPSVDPADRVAKIDYLSEFCDPEHIALMEDVVRAANAVESAMHDDEIGDYTHLLEEVSEHLVALMDYRRERSYE